MTKSVLSIISALLLVLVTGCREKNDSGAATLDVSAMVEDEPSDIDPSTIIEPEPEPDKPEVDSAAIERLRSTAEVKSWLENSPDADKYREGILPQMAEDSPDYAKRLLKNKFDYFIVVDKPSMYVVLFDKYGRREKSYRMACARNYGSKHNKNDCRTPEGFFCAGDTYDSTDWLYTDEKGYTSPTKGVYGPRFIRVVNPVSGTIGIHGTGSPGSLGMRVSHGCIRLHNESILDLVEYARNGMPIIVNPSNRDMKVNDEEGYDIPRIRIGKNEKIYDPIAERQRRVKAAEADSLARAAEAEHLRADSIATTFTEAPDTIPSVISEPVSTPDDDTSADSGN